MITFKFLRILNSLIWLDNAQHRVAQSYRPIIRNKIFKICTCWSETIKKLPGWWQDI